MQMSLAASICGTRRRLMRCILPQMSHTAVGILICTSTKFLYRMTLALRRPRHADGQQSRTERMLPKNERCPPCRAALLRIGVGEQRTFLRDAIDVRCVV